VRLSLTGGDNELRLQIADTGTGFEPDKPTGGLGLIGMKERARVLGATLSVESVPREGTRIDVRVPMPERTRTN